MTAKALSAEDRTRQLGALVEEILRDALAGCLPRAEPVAPAEPGQSRGIEPSAVYSVEECAKALRTCREQVYAWIRSGQLPAFHLERNSKKWLLYGSDIIALIKRLKEDNGNA
ncbi:MAG: helix-turn-helix domain-containing protein [Christensenellaceae bacterium]|nr:helix-turn-helix domain-containing protein [Christensenellaceae bacterium]MEA5070257.1 helix-turn-helix domain-containing protein [Christensenellaceae bacterium]